MKVKLNIHIFVFWSLFLLYGILILFLFYPFYDCLSNPAFKYDFSLHFSNTLNVLKYFTTDLRTWGYNPNFSAGSGEALAPSARILLVWFYLTSFIPREISFNIFIFLIYFIMPLLQMQIVTLFSDNKIHKATGYALGVAIVLGSEIGREFLYIGHFGFFLASFLCLLTVGYLHQYLKNSNVGDLVKSSVVCSISVWVHPLSVLMLFIYLIFTLHANRRVITRNSLFKMLMSFGIFVFFPHFNWMFTFIMASLIRITPGEMAHFLQSTDPHYRMYLSDPFTIVLTLFLLVILIRKKNLFSNLSVLLLAPAIIFALLAVVGSQVGLGNLQPTRFYLPYLMTTGTFVIWYFEKYSSYLVIIFCSCILFSGFSPRNDGNFCSIDPKAEKLISYMKSELDTDGRILVQDSLYELPYFNSRFISYLQYRTGLAFLSDIFPIPFRHHQFRDDIIFNQSIDSISEKEFLDYAKIYNISHVLIYSGKAKKRFDKMTFMEKIYDEDSHTIYRLKGVRTSYCYLCNADVKFQPDRIVVSNATIGENILKFKYLANLKIEPSDIQIESIKIGNDPDPFIRVKNGTVVDYTIYLRTPLVDWSY